MCTFLKLRYLVFLTLVTPLVKEGDAIKCYMCNSKSDPRCEDPFQTDSGIKPVDCMMDQQQSEKTRQAIKEVLSLLTRLGQANSGSTTVPKMNDSIPMACQKMQFLVMGEIVTGRGCSSNNMDWYHPCDTLKLITSKDVVLRSCSLCDTDGCNAATNAFNSVKWTVSLFIVLIHILNLSKS